jgi:hypothetical protein
MAIGGFKFAENNDEVPSERRQTLFKAKLPKLMETLARIYTRTQHTSEAIEDVLFVLGIQCIDEFREIVLLCENNCGIGGLKILRPLYERAVTMQYLAKHPDKVAAFIDYNAVNLGKFYKHAAREFDLENQVPPERAAEIENEYKDALDAFGRRPWSGLNVLDMAKKAVMEGDEQSNLFGLYGLCFFRPTMHIHTTSLSFNDYVEVKDDTLQIKRNAQQAIAWQTLLSAHAVMLHVLKIQDDYFKLDVDETLVNDFLEIWRSEPASATA